MGWTIAIIFVIVWVALVFGYCAFKLIGGNFSDIFTCDLSSCWCCIGPLCDCWGRGGRIRRGRFDDPFRNYRLPVDPEAGELPPILVSEDGLRKNVDRADQFVRNERIDDLRERGADGRGRADSALLLSSRTREGDRARASAPVIV
jgi:hypothetical protein